MVLLKVAAHSRNSSLAGAIAGVIREHNYAELQAIGAAAVNQTIKAIVLADGYLMGEGRRNGFRVEFVSVELEPGGRTVTGIKFMVEPLPLLLQQREG